MELTSEKLFDIIYEPLTVFIFYVQNKEVYENGYRHNLPGILELNPRVPCDRYLP